MVTSLTELARLVARARRSPLTGDRPIPVGEVGPSALEPSRLITHTTAAFELADLVDEYQPAHAVDDV
jgi:hypothetical protein